MKVQEIETRFPALAGEMARKGWGTHGGREFTAGICGGGDPGGIWIGARYCTGPLVAIQAVEADGTKSAVIVRN